MHSMKLVISLRSYWSLYWSIHTKDESKRESAFAFIFGANWPSSFVASQHCLASFRRQTNIKISWDLGSLVKTTSPLNIYFKSFSNLFRILLNSPKIYISLSLNLLKAMTRLIPIDGVAIYYEDHFKGNCHIFTLNFKLLSWN